MNSYPATCAPSAAALEAFARLLVLEGKYFAACEDGDTLRAEVVADRINQLRAGLGPRALAALPAWRKAQKG